MDHCRRCRHHPSTTCTHPFTPSPSGEMHFPLYFRYRWVHPSGAITGRYRQPTGLGWAVKTLLLREQLDFASFLPLRLIEKTGKLYRQANRFLLLPSVFNRRGSICQLPTRKVRRVIALRRTRPAEATSRLKRPTSNFNPPPTLEKISAMGQTAGLHYCIRSKLDFALPMPWDPTRGTLIKYLSNGYRCTSSLPKSSSQYST